MEEFGYPPVFPPEEEEVAMETPSEQTQADPTKKNKKVKSKVAAKGGGTVYQWKIMKSLGLADEEIKEFADPLRWLAYFPPATQRDLRSLGVRVCVADTMLFETVHSAQ